ncbi:MAG: plastocyanin/azurin family copper-binding protein [Solirubrobacterales bacterium]
MRFRTLITLVIAALMLLAVAGCGDDDNGSDSAATPAPTEQTATEDDAGSGDALALAADPDGGLSYDKDALTAPAGAITVDFTNDSSVPHDVVVEDADEKELGKTDQITESKAALELTDVAAGDYTFYCSVPGHQQAGMKGTLKVE